MHYFVLNLTFFLHIWEIIRNFAPENVWILSKIVDLFIWILSKIAYLFVWSLS